MTVKPRQRWTYANVVLLRSGLFSASRCQPGSQRFARTIPCPGRTQIEYYGCHLSQYDYDVLLALQYASLQTNVTRLEPHTILLNRLFNIAGKQGYGRTDYQLVHNAVSRLASAHCCIRYQYQHFCGQLFSLIKLTRAGKQITYVLNQNYVSFLQKTPSIQLDLQQRADLPKGLVRWLHGFLLTYNPVPILSLDDLHHYSGAQEKRRGNFKYRLLTALEQLTQVGFIEPHWWVSRNGVILLQRKILIP